MLIDEATIHVRSGKGGDGCVSFLRLKYVPKGGPDGGDGGKGGDVILLADPNTNTLQDFTGRHHFSAENGEGGRGKQQHGKNGNDLIITMPPGTLVFDDDTGELLIDLDEPGKTHVIAKGGKGGLGNEHFATATHQTPREHTPGEAAEEFTLRLELKLMADVGLVGKPNAGKSTLLSRISRARPKIADYPFTTLEPHLGIAELSASSTTGQVRRLVMADIPGLIEGAAEGHGLGTKFLRHIERTGVLIHLLEVEPEDGSNPVENYHAIRRELEAFSPELAAKPEIIAISKVELLGGEEDHEVARQMIGGEIDQPVMAISSATGEGITDLLEKSWALVQRDKVDEPAWQPDATSN